MLLLPVPGKADPIIIKKSEISRSEEQLNPLEGLVIESLEEQTVVQNENSDYIQENFKSKTKLDEISQAALNIFIGGRIL